MARVFEEDEVSVIDGKILKCGLVLESSEFASSDEDEDNPYISKLKKGAIRVAWHPDGAEEELDESKVTAQVNSLVCMLDLDLLLPGRYTYFVTEISGGRIISVTTYSSDT